jgi:hypothetical protein
MPEHEHGSRLKSFKNNGRDLDVDMDFFAESAWLLFKIFQLAKGFETPPH